MALSKGNNCQTIYINAGGQTVKPWGEVRYQSGTLPTDYTFTGPAHAHSHTADPSVALRAGFGLMYYVARWYDPVLGRFAQADSIVPGAEIQFLRMGK